MLSLIASLLVLLGAFSAIAQPQSQYSASSVKYTDGGFLQEKNDRRCSEFFLEGNNPGTAPPRIETTSAVTSSEFKNVAFRQDVLGTPYKTLTQIGTDWSAGTADEIELIYSPSDNLAGTFICRWTANMLHVVTTPPAAAQPLFVSLGVGAGAPCANGDELTTNYIVSGIEEIWESAAGSTRVVFTDGDRLCLMVSTFGGDTSSFLTTGFSLECTEQSIMGDGTTCYH